MSPAIRVENLSKCYRINHAAAGRENYKTLRESLAGAIQAPFKKWKSNGNGSPKTEDFWALKDVSFEVKPGEVVGIIGRNGAGKSTLLKILSRITKPTSGRVSLHGRVGSLLEVGTGFHPELTGRENVYLNGSILGMSRREIDRQFDAIVDFSGVEKFLDTPVKRYSSGMYVRLAFAVAAHLNPEILVVDEVLAVGDAQFQAKCMGKMGDIARSGHTVLLVSHNMAAIANLCTNGVVLNGGAILHIGSAETAVAKYMTQHAVTNNGDPTSLSRFRPAWAAPLIQSVRLANMQGKSCTQFELGSDILFEAMFDTKENARLDDPVMGIVINHATLGAVGGINTRMTGFRAGGRGHSRGTLQCRIKRLPLLQGSYTADIWLGDGSSDLDVLTGCLAFDIEATDIYKTGQIPLRQLGAIFLDGEFKFREIECMAGDKPNFHCGVALTSIEER